MILRLINKVGTVLCASLVQMVRSAVGIGKGKIVIVSACSKNIEPLSLKVKYYVLKMCHLFG